MMDELELELEDEESVGWRYSIMLLGFGLIPPIVVFGFMAYALGWLR